MANAISLTGELHPVGMADFAILEDNYLIGSLRILEKDSDKDSLDVSTMKEGMLVRCLDTKKLYILSKIIYQVDDFGDETYSASWTELIISVDTSSGTIINPSRWKITLRTPLLNPGDYNQTILQFAKSVILDRLQVDKICDIELKESNLDILLNYDFNQTLKYSFTDPENLVLKNQFTFKDGTPLITRHQRIFMNKDPVPQKFIYYQVTNTSSSATMISSTFTIMGIDLGA